MSLNNMTIIVLHLCVKFPSVVGRKNSGMQISIINAYHEAKVGMGQPWLLVKVNRGMVSHLASYEGSGLG